MAEEKRRADSRGRRLIGALRRGVRRAGSKLPAGVRTVLGVILIVAGLFGFLPILGFWMIPVGVAFIALDVPPLRRRLAAWRRGAERE